MGTCTHQPDDGCACAPQCICLRAVATFAAATLQTSREKTKLELLFLLHPHASPRNEGRKWRARPECCKSGRQGVLNSIPRYRAARGQSSCFASAARASNSSDPEHPADQPNDLKAEIKLFHWIIWGAPPRKSGTSFCARSLHEAGFYVRIRFYWLNLESLQVQTRQILSKLPCTMLAQACTRQPCTGLYSCTVRTRTYDSYVRTYVRGSYVRARTAVQACTSSYCHCTVRARVLVRALVRTYIPW